MASEDVQTNLRLPADLKDRLQSSAAENNRSLSAEVASRLAASYAGPGEPYVTKSQLERVFKKITEEQDSAMMAVTLVRDMLGSYVTSLYRRLPPSEQKKEENRLMNELARAAIDADGEALKKAAAQRFSGTPGFEEVEEPNEFFEYLGRVNQLASQRRRKMLDGDSSTVPHKDSQDRES
ncbi:Arc family DNA-binding protein [Comamonas sp. SY3]|uniref:Arc family DNA-binding protein n=1 Tax=Comamonas sp. SY3 TaxID=3243601 RepID=UPI0035944705